jgi:hypothetical protein
MASKNQGRRVAAQAARGQYKPSPIGAKARKAATLIEQDREWITRIKLAGWWDNGASLQDYRHEGTAEFTYNYAVDLVDNWGVPSNLLNIVPGSQPRRYYVFAARTS